MNKNYVLIDSKNRLNTNNTSSSNFRINLPKTIRIKSYIKINYLYMPRCNYLINSSNNKIVVNLNNQNYITIIFPSQNYTPLTLSNYINICVNNTNSFNCVYNNSTYKYDFQANIDFSIDFSQSNFYKLINLDKKIYSSNNKQFSSGLVNFNKPNYINVNLSNISNDVMIGATNQQVNFIIPCAGTTNFSEIIQYNNVNYNVEMKVLNLMLNYLDVIITDDEGILFDNNNFDWFMILEFDGIENYN